MPRHEPVDDIEDEEGDEEGLRTLAQQDDDGLVQELAIDLDEGCFDRQRPDLLLLATEGMEDGEFATHHGAGLALAGRRHHRIAPVGDLADLDEAYARQPVNSLDLKLELSAVEVPETFAEAAQRAAFDLGHSALDRADIVPIVEIELEQREDERHRRAEEKDIAEEAQTDAAAQVVERAPRRPDPGAQQPGLGRDVVRVGVRSSIQPHAILRSRNRILANDLGERRNQLANDFANRCRGLSNRQDNLSKRYHIKDQLG
jgi:hypothetical protein